MENSDTSIVRARSQWNAMKLNLAKRKLEKLFVKYGLNVMNPGCKEFLMSPSHYDELREGFDRFMRLYMESKGQTYDGKGTMVYNGKYGPVKIKRRD